MIAGTTYLGSNEKAVRELGFSARSLREGMDQTLEHELRALARLIQADHANLALHHALRVRMSAIIRVASSLLRP